MVLEKEEEGKVIVRENRNRVFTASWDSIWIPLAGEVSLAAVAPVEGYLIQSSTTYFLACSDILGNGQKCHYKWGVTVTSQFYCKVDPIEAKKVSL